MASLRGGWSAGFGQLDMGQSERLATLVPRPRVHLVTYHGVLAPASPWRDMVIPSPPGTETRRPGSWGFNISNGLEMTFGI